MTTKTGKPLAARYGALLFDCDGVVYLRDHVVPAAPEALTRAHRDLGVSLAYVTNNSAVAPEGVVAKLRRMGLPVEPHLVVTSAQAAVRLLGGPGELAGARVLVVGGGGLRDELTAAGAVLVGPDDDWRDAATVVVGLAPELTYQDLARATLAIDAGARYVGTNPDLTLPTRDGPWPGAGALLAALTAATGRTPEIAGKPAAPLLEEAAARAGDGPYLMVGDRPDTDLSGAQRLGWDTALVLTGVTRPDRLLDVDVDPPTWLLHDVGGLTDPEPPLVRPSQGAAEARAAAGLLGSVTNGDDAPRGTVVAVMGGEVVGAVAWSRGGGLGDGGGGGGGTVWLRGPVFGPAAGGRAEEGVDTRLLGARLLLAAAHRWRWDGVVTLRADARGRADGELLAWLGFRSEDGAAVRALRPAAGRRDVAEAVH